MSSHDLFREYQGQIVSQSYNAGFVALSYVVSLVGAGSTLELINRRTAFRGLFNQYTTPSFHARRKIILTRDQPLACELCCHHGRSSHLVHGKLQLSYTFYV